MGEIEEIKLNKWIVSGILFIFLGIFLPFFSDYIFPNKEVCSFRVPLEDIHTGSYKQKLNCYLAPSKYIAYIYVDVYSRVHTNLRPRPIAPKLYIYLRFNKRLFLGSMDEDGGTIIAPFSIQEKTNSILLELETFAGECCIDEYYKELFGKLVIPLFDYRLLFLLIPIGVVLFIGGLAKYLAATHVISK